MCGLVTFFVNFVNQLFQVAHAAVDRVDVLMIDNVVAAILAARWIARREPDDVRAYAFDVVEFLSNSVEIADAIVVGIFIGSRDLHVIFNMTPNVQ